MDYRINKKIVVVFGIPARKCSFVADENSPLLKKLFMRLKITVLGLIIVVISPLFTASVETVNFQSPLDFDLLLSATFGELRPGHFHSGVDFKTGGTEGHNVYAADAGWIYRISVGPTGFGKAVYIRHYNGFSTVYGHLHSFSPELEKFVEDEQYKRESFNVNIFPARERFLVSKGELIGFSGNTGSSAGPHLHFEVRRSSNENPVDPMQFFDIQDDISPRIDKLYIYSLDSLPGNEYHAAKKIFEPVIENGVYHIRNDQILTQSGTFGIGIVTWDYINRSWNKCGVESIDLRIDKKQVYNHDIDEFSFSESRYINSHIDYGEYIARKRYVQKTFIDPNNKLTIYNWAINRGRVLPTDNEIHNVEIRVTDFKNNVSVMKFRVKSNRLASHPEARPKDGILFRYDTINHFTDDGITIDLPKDALYNNIFFTYRVEQAGDDLLSNVHHIHNEAIPLNSSFNMELNVPHGIMYLADKLCLVRIDKNNKIYAGGKYSNGKISLSSRDFGAYAISADTVSPSIEPVNFREASNLSGIKHMTLKIDDEFSGISSYTATINGKWALFEYDPRDKTITCNLDNGRLDNSGNYRLEIEVEDNRGNTTSVQYSFTR